jgi:hypothetical protein
MPFSEDAFSLEQTLAAQTSAAQTSAALTLPMQSSATPNSLVRNFMAR